MMTRSTKNLKKRSRHNVSLLVSRTHCTITDTRHRNKRRGRRFAPCHVLCVINSNSFGSAQLKEATKSVREILGSDGGASNKEIEDALWYYYFDIDKTISYLQSKPIRSTSLSLINRVRTAYSNSA